MTVDNYCLLSFLLISGFVPVVTSNIPNVPEFGKTVPEIIRMYGYPCEVHTVTTEDGYILEVQRIPCGRSGCGNRPRQPVILQHGLMASSLCWVFNLPDKSLAFILADQGYDVWLTNVRGNEYGQRHETLSVDDPEFWDFSWDEFIEHDMPASIDYVLDSTGYEKVLYVGHSMGTNIISGTCASKPEYNDKIALVVLLAPSVLDGNRKSPFKVIGVFGSLGYDLVTRLTLGKFMATNEIMAFITKEACSNSYMTEACEQFVFALNGPTLPERLNTSRVPYWISTFPAQTSTRTVLHFLQSTPESNNFKKYDWGEIVNRVKYGQETPPLYNLSKVTTPTIAYSGDNDKLTDPADVVIAISLFGNMVFNVTVPCKGWGHFDFLIATDINECVYNNMTLFLKKYRTTP